MGTTILISSTNFSGQTSQITFQPDTGGTMSIGTHILPYTTELDYVYGTYTLYFPSLDRTCYSYLIQPTPTPTPVPAFLLQEDGSFILQEDGGYIVIN